MLKKVIYILLIVIMIVSYIFAINKLDNSLSQVYYPSVYDYIDKCKSTTITSEEERINCNNVLSYKNKPIDFGRVFELIDDSLLTIFKTPFLLIAIICIFSNIIITNFNKSGILKNLITRESYRKIITKKYIEALIPGLLVTILFIIKCLFCYFYTNNLNIDNLLYNGVNVSSIIYLSLLICYSILVGLVYTNISIAIARYQKNWLVSSIMTIITIVGLELLFEIVVNGIILNVFKSEMGMLFNIIDYKYYNLSFGAYTPILVMLVINILLMIYNYNIYKDSESMIVDLDK